MTFLRVWNVKIKDNNVLNLYIKSFKIHIFKLRDYFKTYNSCKNTCTYHRKSTGVTIEVINLVYNLDTQIKDKKRTREKNCTMHKTYFLKFLNLFN